ncbi:MAG: TetR/AcrR family transcriptional regulator [Crocinitomicaceae bacterium]|nr:TetR/AcrR family transcriptional regulator [Crocinitomicaceae bacterium]
MNNLFSKINIKVNENVFLKDPESSDLGQRIVEHGIDLIDELGFEDFTFKKLAKKIGSTEASIYRYFENKHTLLVYLVLWYWGWQEYRIVMNTLNIEDPKVKLRRAMRLLTEKIEEDSTFSRVNEIKLNRIVNAESSKIYLSKKVDQDNALGFFRQYQEVVQRVSDFILEINPQFKYPHMLVSTIIEGAHHQRFFAKHLPRLTDEIEGEDAISTFYINLVLKTISEE